MPKSTLHTSKGLLLYLDLLMILVISGFFGVYTFSILLGTLYPQSLNFLGGLLPSEYLTFPVWLLLTIYQGYVYAAMCSGAATLIATSVIFWVYLYIFINHELKLNRAYYLTNSSLRSFDSLQRLFRAFQLVHKSCLIEGHFEFYIVGLNAYLQLISIFLSFVLIRFWKDISFLSKGPLLIGLLIALGSWGVFLEIGGRMQVGSKSTIMSWNRHNWETKLQNKLMALFCRSCKPIVWCYGNHFVVGRKSVLTFYKGVNRGTVRSLLMVFLIE